MQTIDKKLYCFWFGPPMSQTRQESLQKIKNLNTELDIVLVTEDNLSDYIVEPLHRGYTHLIPEHKADYLRCYFMHFYGGCYSDIKSPTGSWIQSIQDLENSDCWFMGFYHPTAVWWCGPHIHLLASHYKNYLGDQGFICKPNTAFTTEWYEELMQTMGKNYHKLKNSPRPYPLKYKEILFDIIEPLWHKYENKLLRTLPPLDCQNYL